MCSQGIDSYYPTLQSLFANLLSTQLVITDRRNQLGSDVVKAGECLKSWSKNGLTSTDVFERAMRSISDGEVETLQRELDDYYKTGDAVDAEDTGDELN